MAIVHTVFLFIGIVACAVAVAVLGILLLLWILFKISGV